MKLGDVERRVGPSINAGLKNYCYKLLNSTFKQEIREIINSVTLNVSKNKSEPQEDCNPNIKTKVEELCRKLNSQRGK